MNKTVFEELDHLIGLKAALESFDTLPPDAIELLNVFKQGTPSFESMEFGDKKVSLESVGSKVKELVIAAAKWIKTQIVEFIAFLKSGKLEIGTVEKELEAIKSKVAEAKSYHTDEITLSPLVTGYLAINGVLDNTFASNMSRVRDAVSTIIDLQPSAIKVAKNIIEWTKTLKGDMSDRHISDLPQQLAEFSQYYGRKLVAVDKTKTAFGPNRATNVTVFTKANIKVQDMTSLPLPGGYALTGALISVPPSISLSADLAEEIRIEGIVEGLVKTISPELVKVQSAGIKFSGTALSQSDCKKVIDESGNLLDLLKRTFDDTIVKSTMSELTAAVDHVSSTINTSMNLGGVEKNIRILRDLVKFIELDKSQITRYSLKVIRAAVRYINASIVPAEDVVPVSERNRLPAPAAV